MSTEALPVRRSMRRVLAAEHPGGVIAAVLLGAITVAAVLAPLIAPQNPFDLAALNLNDAFAPPAWTEAGRGAYPLGTDDQGRDLLSTIMHGARISLGVGLASVLFALTLGVTLGLLSGYLGGRMDAFIMRIADVQLSFPAILIALLVDGVARVALPSEVHDDIADPGADLLHRHLRLGALRAHRARQHAGGEEQGVRAGGARHRPAPARDHVAPRAP